MLASVDVVACEKGEASARGSGRTLLALVHELDAILQKLAGGLDKLLNLIGHAGGLYGAWDNWGEQERNRNRNMKC